MQCLFREFYLGGGGGGEAEKFLQDSKNIRRQVLPKSARWRNFYYDILRINKLSKTGK